MDPLRSNRPRPPPGRRSRRRRSATTCSPGSRDVRAREQGRERGRAARLREDPDLPPEPALRLEDLVARDQNDALDVLRDDLERDLARSLGAERVRRVPAVGDVDWPARRERRMQRPRARRLDADEFTRLRQKLAAPAIRPPPPTATSTVSASGTCSQLGATVPCPATISGGSYGCSTSAPLSSARRGSRRAPRRSTRRRPRPRRRRRGSFADLRRARGDEDARAPRARAPRTQSRPVVAAGRRDHAHFRPSEERSLLKAPRGLNEPVCCGSSSFSVTRASSPNAPGSKLEHGRSANVTVEFRWRAVSTSARPRITRSTYRA